MKRREFLKSAIIGTAVATIPLTLAKPEFTHIESFDPCVKVYERFGKVVSSENMKWSDKGYWEKIDINKPCSLVIQEAPRYAVLNPKWNGRVGS